MQGKQYSISFDYGTVRNATETPYSLGGNTYNLTMFQIEGDDNAQRLFEIMSNNPNKELTERHVKQLLLSGKTRLIKGFQGKSGKTFDACLTFDEHFNLTFRFPNKKPKNGNKAAE